MQERRYGYQNLKKKSKLHILFMANFLNDVFFMSKYFTAARRTIFEKIFIFLSEKKTFAQ